MKYRGSYKTNVKLCMVCLGCSQLLSVVAILCTLPYDDRHFGAFMAMLCAGLSCYRMINIILHQSCRIKSVIYYKEKNPVRYWYSIIMSGSIAFGCVFLAVSELFTAS